MANYNTLRKNINKVLGKNTILTKSEFEAHEGRVFSTGSIGLDIASGIGGFACGRVSEIWGWQQSGKTTICLHAVVDCQDKGGVAVFVDVENALDLTYAEKIGVNTDELLLAQPDSGEGAFRVVYQALEGGADLIIIDSVARMTPEAELAGDFGDSKIGLHARLMSQGMRKLIPLIKKSNAAVIFINQVRHKMVLFGNPETTTGGNALAFYASQRLEVRGRNKPTSDNKSVEVTGKWVKNKLAPPFQKASYEILFGYGIDNIAECLDIGVGMNIIQKKGNTYSFKDEKLGGSRARAVAFLEEEEGMYTTIYDQIMDQGILALK